MSDLDHPMAEHAIYTPNGETVTVLEDRRERYLGWGRGSVEEVRIDAGHGPIWCPITLLDPSPTPRSAT